MCSLMQARRALFPGGIPGQSFLSSAAQCPTANLSCAIAFDDQNIKMAQSIGMTFSTEGSSVVEYPAAKNLSASRRFEIEPNQMSGSPRANLFERGEIGRDLFPGGPCSMGCQSGATGPIDQRIIAPRCDTSRLPAQSKRVARR